MRSRDLSVDHDSAGRLLSDEILAYLKEHPEAQDTAQGVAEWWLLQRMVKQTLGEVEAALRELVAKGFLVARTAEDGRTLYRLNRAQEREIQGHLRDRRAKPNRPARSRIQRTHSKRP